MELCKDDFSILGDFKIRRRIADWSKFNRKKGKNVGLSERERKQFLAGKRLDLTLGFNSFYYARVQFSAEK